MPNVDWGKTTSRVLCGLVIGNIRRRNERSSFLMGMVVWRFLDEPKALWHEVITAKHYYNSRNITWVPPRRSLLLKLPRL